jgi:hypothetical protein
MVGEICRIGRPRIGCRWNVSMLFGPPNGPEMGVLHEGVSHEKTAHEIAQDRAFESKGV